MERDDVSKFKEEHHPVQQIRVRHPELQSYSMFSSRVNAHHLPDLLMERLGARLSPWE
ncbi:hypothetical protein M501DRAFT_999682 [Patellaria atrata CBS 101060]|uniref:Uncharacterized protein n=1 Tax=Patellaria atrata CBS 101060 TaxID=1346257 RepID=A0A9P4VMQ6_9PEZI|nr:hypothetical protein M501DRAFT_999682 [Patellaria atrata CBS 101060]